MSAKRATAPTPEDLKLPRRFSTSPDYAPQGQRVEDVEARHVRVVGAASALLAVCFVIITTLVYTHMSDDTLGDEIAWFAGAFFLGTIVLSGMAVRRPASRWRIVWVDRLLLIGLAILTTSMVVVGVDLH
jgi:predicted outer membrane lipoprotein